MVKLRVAFLLANCCDLAHLEIEVVPSSQFLERVAHLRIHHTCLLFDGTNAEI
jgi:hypothetical protein